MIVKTYASTEDVAIGIIEELIAPKLERGVLTLAVSGGSTPRQLFEIMATSYRTALRWENLRVYWVDERCVAPTDGQSNFRMFAEALSIKEGDEDSPYELLSKLGHISRIKGEEAPELEANRYTNLVCEALPHTSDGMPIFDLILLGIGIDGHTSSIFPHQMHLLEECTPYMVAQNPEGQKRICLTGQTILAGRVVAFHAVGSDKRDILHSIAFGNQEAEVYPSRYFVKERKDIMLFTDQTL